MGKYRIASYEMVYTKHHSFWDYWTNGGSTTSPEYFAGIQFNMANGECLNQRPDLKHQVVLEVRRQWLKDVAQWRKGMMLRDKLGVLNAIADGRNFFKNNSSKRMYTELLCSYVAEAIRTQDFSKDTLDVIVANIGISIGTSAIGDFIKSNSLQIRMAYGVFGEHNKKIFQT